MNQQPPADRQEKEEFVEDVRSLLSATGHMVEEQIAEARKRLAAALEDGGKLFNSIEERAAEGAKCTDKAVREHPYTAVAIALGIGVLIGQLTMRQNSRSRGWLH